MVREELERIALVIDERQLNPLYLKKVAVIGLG